MHKTANKAVFYSLQYEILINGSFQFYKTFHCIENAALL